MTRGEKVGSLVGHENRVSCLGVSNDGISLCTGSWDSLVSLAPTYHTVEFRVVHDTDSTTAQNLGILSEYRLDDYTTVLWIKPDSCRFAFLIAFMALLIHMCTHFNSRREPVQTQDEVTNLPRISASHAMAHPDSIRRQRSGSAQIRRENLDTGQGGRIPRGSVPLTFSTL